MKIQFDEYRCCVSTTCLFRRECAQHTSAGDFRTEGGFRPEIFGDECFTANQPAVEDISGTFPKNIEQLDCGFITETYDGVIDTRLPPSEQVFLKKIADMIKDYEDSNKIIVGGSIIINSKEYIFNGDVFK